MLVLRAASLFDHPDRNAAFRFAPVCCGTPGLVRDLIMLSRPQPKGCACRRPPQSCQKPTPGPVWTGFMWALRERALPGLFHELLASEEAEERQVPIPQIELDPRGVWRVRARPLGKVDHPRLSSLEVYAPAAPGCRHRIFVSYPCPSYLFAHGRSLPAAEASRIPRSSACRRSEKLPRATSDTKVFGPAKPLRSRVAIDGPSDKPRSRHNGGARG